ncbi:MAG TPA: outer membrane beta-barrel protein [Xanthobacteraceae bacterium]|nr:outer membrane beta-barrel protein [Xanthobacteraceae bacterium]
MRRLVLVAGIALSATIVMSGHAMAADVYGAWKDGLPTAWAEGPACDPLVDYNCNPTKMRTVMARKAAALNGPCDPYVDYKCLDAYLGDDFFTRFVRYYQLEWGKAAAPSDPNAPPSRRSDAAWPPTPQSSPPMPFTEWPYGGAENIGVTRPNSVDSPLMVALGNTRFGQAMSDAHVQVYGWVAPGANLSTNTVKPGGNAPVAYDYTPNTVQLDQAVVYVERLADTTQNDHFDWGFRVSALYGVDYRYTTAYGLFSYQLLNHNNVGGFDFPMVYTDLYFPVMQGMDVRIGRFISIPDIEAQLAPNNYTYVHSLTYTFDNYTNTGIEVTTAITKNWILQLGLTAGSDTMPWNVNAHVPNLMPGNALYPGATLLKDPGAVPSGTLGVRWTSDDGRDNVNVVMDAWNGGQWGYNNLQWIGLTYYHKVNDYWHFAFETWNIHENNVPNLNSAAANAIIAGGGTPFSPQFVPFNAPNAAWCSGPRQFGNAAVAGAPLTCQADEQSFLVYLNYSPNKLNNFSLRTEYFNDPQGQRTGVPTAYADWALSWQHWLSPQIEIRPELAYYRAIDNNAFNGNVNAGIAPTRNWAVIAASDLIIHF